SPSPNTSTHRSGFDMLREVVARRVRRLDSEEAGAPLVRRSHRGVDERDQPPPAYIDAVIAEIAGQFGDASPTRSNVAHARRLFAGAGLPVEAFVARLYEAQSLT